jgi:hypothetical protein
MDIAWMAGIIEGEGCIHVISRGDGVQVKVTMTDLDIIQRLHETSGIGLVRFASMKGRERHKPQFSWIVQRSRDVARLLCAIAPVLGERRRAACLKAAERLARIRPQRRKNSPLEHGTVFGYQAERRRGLATCALCRSAVNIYNQERRAERALSTEKADEWLQCA